MKKTFVDIWKKFEEKFPELVNYATYPNVDDWCDGGPKEIVVWISICPLRFPIERNFLKIVLEYDESKDDFIFRSCLQ